MHRLRVQPGESLGPFVLGMSLNDVVALLARRPADMPRAAAPWGRVELVYDPKLALERDTVVRLADLGVVLRFDGAHQVLRLIEVNDLAATTLSYGDVDFRSTAVHPTFWQIYQTFGPTYPGDMHATTNTYVLHYPGLSFLFPIPPQYTPAFSSKHGRANLPIEFDNGTTPVCTRLYVYPGESLAAALIGAEPRELVTPGPTPDGVGKETALLMTADPPRPALPRLSAAAAEVVYGQVGHGIHLATRNQAVLFGQSPQDVIMALGMPQALHFRHGSAVVSGSSLGGAHGARSGTAASGGKASHRPASALAALLTRDAPSYFWNYFALGIDVLFDGEQHQVQAIVLHTNTPGHAYFLHYRRAAFRIEVPRHQRVDRAEISLIDDVVEAPSIRPDTTWDEVQALLGKPKGVPVVATPASPTSPFGAVHIYGYDGLVVQVLESNLLHSVTLCRP